MANYSRRSNVLMVVNSSGVFAPGAGYLVTVYPVGAQVASTSTSSPITVKPGHGFTNLQKFIVWRSGALVASSYRAVSGTPTAFGTSIAYSGSNLSLSAGDYLINLGRDTGSTSPSYARSANTTPIYSTPDGSGTATSNSTVTASSDGSYGYWIEHGLPSWELVRSDSSTPCQLILDTSEKKLYRTISVDPTASATLGMIGEIVYSTLTPGFYGKHTTSASDTNWTLLG